MASSPAAAPAPAPPAASPPSPLLAGICNDTVCRPSAAGGGYSTPARLPHQFNPVQSQQQPATHLASILCGRSRRGPARLLAAGGQAGGALQAAGCHKGTSLLAQVDLRPGSGRPLGLGACWVAGRASAAHGRLPIGWQRPVIALQCAARRRTPLLRWLPVAAGWGVCRPPQALLATQRRMLRHVSSQARGGAGASCAGSKTARAAGAWEALGSYNAFAAAGAAGEAKAGKATAPCSRGLHEEPELLGTAPWSPGAFPRVETCCSGRLDIDDDERQAPGAWPASPTRTRAALARSSLHPLVTPRSRQQCAGAVPPAFLLPSPPALWPPLLRLRRSFPWRRRKKRRHKCCARPASTRASSMARPILQTPGTCCHRERGRLPCRQPSNQLLLLSLPSHLQSATMACRSSCWMTH